MPASEVADVSDASSTVAEEPSTPTETPSPAPADTPTSSVDGDHATDAETPPASHAPAPEPGTGTPEEAAEPDLSTYPAFSYRAEGRGLGYPGAHQDEDGNVLFTPPAVQQLKHDLAYARAYSRRDAEAQRDMARESKAREAAETTLQQVLGSFDQMVEQSQGVTTLEELAQTPLGQWLLGLHQTWPKLRSDAMQRGFEIRTKAQQEELDTFRQRDLDSQQRPVMLSRVDEAVRQWGQEAGLSDAEQKALVAKYHADDMLDQLFPRLKTDDPVNGLRAGQRTENLEPLRQELLFLHGILKGRTPQQAAQDVKNENAKRLGQTGAKAPPMAGVGRGKPAGTKPKTYTSTREADEEIWG